MILLGIGTAIILVALLIQVNILHHQLKISDRKREELDNELFETQKILDELIKNHNILVKNLYNLDEMDNIDNILPFDLTNSIGIA